MEYICKEVFVSVFKKIKYCNITDLKDDKNYLMGQSFNQCAGAIVGEWTFL